MLFFSFNLNWTCNRHSIFSEYACGVTRSPFFRRPLKNTTEITCPLHVENQPMVSLGKWSKRLQEGNLGIPGLVNIQKATWKMAIEIVDFAIQNGGSFHSYVSWPEGITWHHRDTIHCRTAMLKLSCHQCCHGQGKERRWSHFWANLRRMVDLKIGLWRSQWAEFLHNDEDMSWSSQLNIPWLLDHDMLFPNWFLWFGLFFMFP